MKKFVWVFLMLVLFVQCFNKADDNQKVAVDNNEVENENCSDILSFLGHMPDGLMFSDCSEGRGQVLYEAEYHFYGKDVFEVEQYFISNSGIGQLVFACCGWEPAEGKRGELDLPVYLRIMKPFLTVSITMFSEETLINDRAKWNDIIMFYVVVEIIEC